MKYKVAIVGATGAVGKVIISILEERNFPIKEMVLFSSSNSAGETILFKDKKLIVKELTEENCFGFDFVFFSAGSKVSRHYAPLIVQKSNGIIIDNSSAFRMDDDIPLIVPEVNSSRIKKGIIANPNCTTAILVVALKPIYDAVGLEKVFVSTYQSVSGSGKSGILELENQYQDIVNKKHINSSVFPVQIASNLIPQIGNILDNGYTEEEMKMFNETRKILEDDSISISSTCVRVPVFTAHSESVIIKTRDSISLKRAKEILSKAPGLKLLKPDQLPFPLELSGKDDCYVGRLRQDLNEHDKGLSFFIVSDQLRKGAALNAVQIAEKSIEMSVI